MPKQPAFPGLRDAMNKKFARREQFRKHPLEAAIKIALEGGAPDRQARRNLARRQSLG